jgi:hypothetical protein
MKKLGIAIGLVACMFVGGCDKEADAGQCARGVCARSPVRTVVKRSVTRVRHRRTVRRERIHVRRAERRVCTAKGCS